MGQVQFHMSHEVLTVTPQFTLERAAKAMTDAKVGSALVMDGGSLVGILTERDVMRLVARGIDSRSMSVDRCMTPDPISVEPGTGTSTAFEIMSKGGFRHLPVVEHGRVVGIVSSRDLLRAAEQQAARQSAIVAGDAERRRMERDIHDGAQQQMVAMTMKLRAAAKLIETDHHQTRGLLAEVETDVEEALETLRGLAQGNYHALLDDLGLASALEAHGRRVDLPVEIEAQGVDRLDAETETAVYFCCLEAIQNVAKHGNASTVKVTLRKGTAELVFSVADDGDGFDPATVQPGSGRRNLTDRLEALGGRLEIKSAPGAGTTVTGWVPLARLRDKLETMS